MLEKYYISKKDNTDLNVYRCGFEECSPGYAWGPGVRDHYIVHVILSGKGTFWADGRQYLLEAGQGFLICPGQIVRYEADQVHPWTYSWVGFHGLKAESILKKAGLEASSPIFAVVDKELVTNRLNDVLAAARHEASSDLMLTGFLYLFLAALVKIRGSQMPDSSGYTGSERYVSKAVEYIEKNYSGALNVKEMARYLGIDRSYLSTLFSHYLGVSPREFIIRYRMDQACALLKNNLLSIGDVARSVGYEDPLQFSKTFRKTKGDSPTHFRESKEPK